MSEEKKEAAQTEAKSGEDKKDDLASMPREEWEAKPLKERIEDILTLIRPYLQRDGGDVALEEVTDDGVVKVRLLGHCYGCPYSIMTIKGVVERVLKQEIPEIKEVISLD